MRNPPTIPVPITRSQSTSDRRPTPRRGDRVINVPSSPPLEPDKVKAFPYEPETKRIHEGVRLDRMPDTMARPEAARREIRNIITACGTLLPVINTWYTVDTIQVPTDHKLMIQDIGVKFLNGYVSEVLQAQVLVGNRITPDIPVDFDRACDCPYTGGWIPVLGRTTVEIQLRRVVNGWELSDLDYRLIGFDIYDSKARDDRMML